MKKLVFVKPSLYLPKNITIVGSSKIILKEKRGKEIDKSNFIVRFNYAPTGKFKRYTGSKTSLRVLNNHVYESLKKNLNNNRYLIIWPSILRQTEARLNCYFFKSKLNQYLLTLRFLKYFDIFLNLILILSRKTFSVGFNFILLGVVSELNLKIFGFDLEENMVKRKHYYKRQKIGGDHDLVSEHKILKKLKNRKLIKLR